MDCNEARPLLDANADHELPAPDARRVQQHIESCAACRRESENLRALSGALRAAPYHRAPQSLRERIVAGLPSVDEPAAAAEAPVERVSGVTSVTPPQRERARRGWLDRWLDGWRAPQGGFGWPTGAGGPVGSGGVFARGWLVVLVVALCAVAAGVALNLRRPAEFGPFADELVESHVRAQVSGRDIDVISTDRHTVKPWFNGRLDYSPPVEDLAANGFALEGGRLDYLAHQRVAVLVYRYQKHVIDVYVFPQAGAGGTGRNTDGAAPATLAREGYSIAHWNAEGMTWWAISDAAPDALKGLEVALKARLQSGSERTEAGS
ncbi:zinc-finger family protein [Paraburkholderia xenovorans LB400]|uniref:Predicted transmembrane Transcriptional regulator (Anti-sigma factor) n=1 Tax=Paraburkholderia xenovorans (strain LB400) TaxID=266265 RepID=Q13ZH3_PARXL|nr:zf-HC2 domain-containing protein [Paraburkholderia xenovorans]ABE30516.1 Predicted transmembrane Transcriptional regulator (anti-sigma factor) [Paraburkholderia xenovorans LB400]AIP31014.1 zinc-finger family protein [Paraburkholderia xenovorans LB400]